MQLHRQSALLLVLALAACPATKKGDASGPASSLEGVKGKADVKQGKTIATIGDTVITEGEFKARLMRQSPFARARYNTKEKKAQFLNNMVRFELLAQEAKRRGLDQDADVQDTMKKVMVQKLIRSLGEKGGDPIPEADMKAFYDAHLADYVKPERARVAHIFFAAAKGDSKARAAAKKKAEAISLQLKKREKEATAFQLIARESSDDAATRATGGDLGYHTHDEFAASWGSSVGDAIFKLEIVGNSSPVVEGDKGFHLLKLTGRQKALNRSFEMVKPQIEGRVRREKRTEIFDGFVEKLKTQAKVTTDESLLDGIEVSGGAAAGPHGGGMFPGGRPGMPGRGGHGGAPGFMHPKMPRGAVPAVHPANAQIPAPPKPAK